MQHYVIGSAQSPNINPEHRPNSWALEWRPPARGSLHLMSELLKLLRGAARGTLRGSTPNPQVENEKDLLTNRNVVAIRGVLDGWLGMI